MSSCIQPSASLIQSYISFLRAFYFCPTDKPRWKEGFPSTRRLKRATFLKSRWKLKMTSLSLSGHFSTLADLWCIFCTLRRITSSSNHRCKTEKNKKMHSMLVGSNATELYRTHSPEHLHENMGDFPFFPFFLQTAKKPEELWEVGRLGASQCSTLDS